MMATGKPRAKHGIKISDWVWKKAQLVRRLSTFDKRAYMFPKSWSQNAVDVVASRYLKTKAKERSIQSLISRVVETIGREGLRSKVLKSPSQAGDFVNQLAQDLLLQRCSFNSPVWFNVGLDSLPIPRSDVMGFRWNPKARRTESVPVASFPQVSACFIQSLDDDLMSIFDLVKSEARVFKFGSGTGTNFSKLRGKGQPLAGGGTTSGLISFLEVFDKAAGAVKSGGTTRRAAKMVIVDAEHPDVLDFIQWKAREEKKAQALIAAGYSPDMEGEAYHTVSGQNANHSVRIKNKWMSAAFAGKASTKSERARKIIQAIAESAWDCGDPGIQFHDTIQKWHTCPTDGVINASNPCSEYMFLDDSACNLASINLMAFLRSTASEVEFDFVGFTETIERLITAQEILVEMASYPTAKIALNSARFRPLGLGFSNLGGLLMRLGVSYASEEARALASALSSLMQSVAVQTSADLAAKLGTYQGFQDNRGSHLKVLQMHFNAHRAAFRKVSRERGPKVDQASSSASENRRRVVQVLALQIFKQGNQSGPLLSPRPRKAGSGIRSLRRLLRREPSVL